jgi:hypothetical protein
MCLKTKTKFFEDEIKYLENYHKKLDNLSMSKDQSPSLSSSLLNVDGLPSPTSWQNSITMQTIPNSIPPKPQTSTFMPEPIKSVKIQTDSGLKNVEEINENDGLKLLENSENERNLLEKELEILRKEDQVIHTKILELIEHAEKFELDHDANLIEINSYENQLLELQGTLKQVQDRKEMYERKLEHMRNFSVLNEAFSIEITDQIGKINCLELGLLPGEKEPNWIHINSAFGNIMLIYSYLIKVNNIENDGSFPVEVCAFGYNSYFNDNNLAKKYFLMGPVTAKNLVF